MNCDDEKKRGEMVKRCIEDKAADLAFYVGADDKKKRECYYNEKISLLPNYWSDADNFRHFVQIFSRNLYIGCEVLKICREYNNINTCGYNCSKCNARHHPFSMLFKLGMMGYIKKDRNNDGVFVQKFNHSKNVTYIRATEVMDINTECIYVLHPALTKSIEHTDKKVLHFNGFLIGKGLCVEKEKFDKLFRDYYELGEKEYIYFLTINTAHT